MKWWYYGIICIIVIVIVTGEITVITNKTCTGSNECKGNRFLCDSNANRCDLGCIGNYSCFNVTLICPSHSTNSKAICNIYCGEDHGCESVLVSTNRTVQVECANVDACDIKVECSSGQKKSGNSTLIKCSDIISSEKNGPLLSDISSKGLNNTFGVFYLLLFITVSVVMIRLYRAGFYISYERFVSVPSILWFQCFYECIICFSLASDDIYLSHPQVSPRVVIYALLVPSMFNLMLLLLCILYSHDKFWHIPILRSLTCKQPILYPYRIGLGCGIMWFYFFVVILPVSLTGNDTVQSTHKRAIFAAVHVVIVSIVGCFLAFMLLSAFISHIQRSHHDAPVMRWLVLSSFITLFLFLFYLLCAIETQQNKADQVRVALLLFEVLMMIGWIYIFPSLCLLGVESLGGEVVPDKSPEKPTPSFVIVDADINVPPAQRKERRTLSLTVDEMFSHNDITFWDVVCCIPNRKWRAKTTEESANAAIENNTVSSGSTNDAVTQVSANAVVLSVLQTGSTRSATRSSIKYAKRQEIQTAVMEDLQLIQPNVHVEVMEDAKIPDAWVCGVVSTRDDQVVLVGIQGNAPVIIPKGTELREDGTVAGGNNETLEAFEVQQKKEILKQNRELLLDLNQDAYRIRLQLFGVDPIKLKRKLYDGYEVELPCILIELRDKLFELKGHEEEGVFRVTPSSRQVEEYRHTICQGKIQSYNYTRPVFDIHILSCLIKVWFREMPTPILNMADKSTVDLILKETLSLESIPQICSQLPPLSRALLYWLFDLCAEVAKYESSNKMGIKALSIVMAPNLYKAEDNDPNTTALLQPKLTQFCTLGIQWRMKERL